MDIISLTFLIIPPKPHPYIHTLGNPIQLRPNLKFVVTESFYNRMRLEAEQLMPADINASADSLQLIWRLLSWLVGYSIGQLSSSPFLSRFFL